MIEFSVKELKERIHGIYKRVGLSEEDADIMTEVLATTEIRGVFSHGFLRTRNYVKALLGGGMKKDADLTVLFDSPSWAMVDGNEALGIPTAYKATKIAIAKAKETGIGIVNVRGSHHCGAVGYYAAMCADEGFFGMCMSNGNPMVAPTGARSTGIGNNPFSYAAPAGKYGKVLYDVAFSAVSDMKILDLRDKGLPMPADWAIRKEDGQPTTDPNDYCKGKAVLTPIAGHKGYGLALMVEIMGAVMSGANILKNVNAWTMTPEVPGNTGHFIMALDISKLQDMDTYNATMEKMIEELKGATPIDPARPVLYPGELEKNREAAVAASGKMSISENTLSLIEEAEALLEKAGL